MRGDHSIRAHSISPPLADVASVIIPDSPRRLRVPCDLALHDPICTTGRCTAQCPTARRCTIPRHTNGRRTVQLRMVQERMTQRRSSRSRLAFLRVFPWPDRPLVAKTRPQGLSARSRVPFLPSIGRKGWAHRASRSCLVCLWGIHFPHHTVTGWQVGATDGSWGYKGRLFARGQTLWGGKKALSKRPECDSTYL